jgi:hypothetical protein
MVPTKTERCKLTLLSYNNPMYIYISIGILGLLIVWALGSYLVVTNIETPKYTVIQKKDGYEVRAYNSYIAAETIVSDSYSEASSAGFRIIADYIFGNNTANNKISMTAPVVENSSEKIAMTAPVIDTESGQENRVISFILPSKYDMESLPKPNNSKVVLIEVPERTVAVLSFTWYPTVSRIEKKKTELLTLLERDGITATGAIQTARYNPPLSMPLTLRNEIIIPIE